ncbi:hypothetical protein [Caldovatus aquaticus]|uniref:Uncharacterized protein n=1 Tax=Caldovatus aquaticus TaxID=2865671 RepID=A0ABS7F202_9PROT|nr:hypothetical protein [Caldovatus aquaticus]MBW8269640.1 hypothetical protein [Caldovatus aquaticus]
MDARPPSPLRGEIKTSRVSLAGGIAVAVAVMALWVALARDLGADGAGPVALGALVAAGIGAWIWKAEL